MVSDTNSPLTNVSLDTLKFGGRDQGSDIINNNHAHIAEVNSNRTNLISNANKSRSNLANLTKSSIKVLSWNIQGIGKKLELSEIRNKFDKYDIIFLFETMKLDSFEPDLINFKYIHSQRKFIHHRARRPPAWWPMKKDVVIGAPAI